MCSDSGTKPWTRCSEPAPSSLRRVSTTAWCRGVPTSTSHKPSTAFPWSAAGLPANSMRSGSRWRCSERCTRASMPTRRRRCRPPTPPSISNGRWAGELLRIGGRPWSSSRCRTAPTRCRTASPRATGACTSPMPATAGSCTLSMRSGRSRPSAPAAASGASGGSSHDPDRERIPGPRSPPSRGDRHHRPAVQRAPVRTSALRALRGRPPARRAGLERGRRGE